MKSSAGSGWTTKRGVGFIVCARKQRERIEDSLFILVQLEKGGWLQQSRVIEALVERVCKFQIPLQALPGEATPAFCVSRGGKKKPHVHF